MKKTFLLLIAILSIVFLFGCHAEKTDPLEDMDVNTNKSELEVELVTKEQIMKYFGFNESELDGINVEAVIKYCHYREEDLSSFSKELFLKCLRLFDEEIKTDIGYLFNGGQPDGEISVSEINNLAFLVGENDRKDYWQIRLQKKKAFYSLGYIEHMDLEKQAMYSGVLTDDYITELLNCLEKAKLHHWNAEYSGNNGDTTGSWGWRLGIELIDGTVYSWRGYGMFGNNQPKEYKSVESVIEQCLLEINENKN